MKIVIASDHAGCYLKSVLVDHLKKRSLDLTDLGTDDCLKSVDYPDYAGLVAEFIKKEKNSLGILICGTGIGMSIASNKFKGIRAALCSDTFSARMSRMHNDANVLCMGARVLGEGLAIDILDAWLDAEFEGDRHQKRLDKITILESK
jgi:ribose 5-phosphate isomerase B